MLLELAILSWAHCCKFLNELIIFFILSFLKIINITYILWIGGLTMLDGSESRKYEIEHTGFATMKYSMRHYLMRDGFSWIIVCNCFIDGISYLICFQKFVELIFPFMVKRRHQNNEDWQVRESLDISPSLVVSNNISSIIN